jgi:hypothetical protein
MQHDSANWHTMPVPQSAILRASVADQPMPEEEQAYVRSYASAFAYAIAIERAQLPILILPPVGYSDCLDVMIRVKLWGAEWRWNVHESLQKVTSIIQIYRRVTDGDFQIMRRSVNALRLNAHDENAKRALSSANLRVTSAADAGSTAIGDFERLIAVHLSRLQSNATELQSRRSKLARDSGANLDSIGRLEGVIARFRDLIVDRNKLALLNTATNLTVNFFLTVVGTAVGIPYESLLVSSILGGGFGIVTGTITTLVPIHDDIEYMQSAAHIQEDIDLISKEIGLLNTTIASLASFCSTLDDLAQKKGAVSSDVSRIQDFWKRQRDDLTALSADIRNMAAAMELARIDEASRLLDEAKLKWFSVAERMSRIGAVTYSVQPNALIS